MPGLFVLRATLASPAAALTAAAAAAGIATLAPGTPVPAVHATLVTASLAVALLATAALPAVGAAARGAPVLTASDSLSGSGRAHSQRGARRGRIRLRPRPLRDHSRERPPMGTQCHRGAVLRRFAMRADLQWSHVGLHRRCAAHGQL